MRVRLGRAAGAPVTTGLLLLNGLIWLGQISPLGYIFTNSMFYAPLFTEYQPWRMITSGFVHDWSGPMHILLNSYAIWIFGRQLEPMLGKLRFLALYLVSIFAGSVAVLWLSNPQVPVVGASGGLFGLMGAYFIIVRSLGSNGSQIFVLIAINLAMGFFIPGISWEGHLGGLIGGLAMAGVYAETRRPEQRVARLLGVAGVVALLLLATWWKVTSSGWS
jgi:membrane associated rhomboid family serine protease